MQEQKKREAYRCLVIITDSHIREQLCEFLADSHIPVYYQMHGIGTASSEWLELCGLGSIQKSITLCFIPNGRKKILLAEMNQALSLHKKGTGIAVSIPMNGMQGFLYKLLNEHTAESDGEEVEKEVKKMSEPITHAMILVTINQGYSDAVMNTARCRCNRRHDLKRSALQSRKIGCHLRHHDPGRTGNRRNRCTKR